MREKGRVNFGKKDEIFGFVFWVLMEAFYTSDDAYCC